MQNLVQPFCKLNAIRFNNDTVISGHRKKSLLQHVGSLERGE